jgi:two-component system, OmpR family, sensor histidine kinase PrrB
MRAPGSLTGRVTLAAVAAVGAALLVASIAVVLVSSRADRSALDRDLRRLAQRSAGPAGRLGPPPGFGGVIGGRPPVADPDGDRSPLGPGDEQFTRLVFANGYVRTGGANVPAGFPVPPARSNPVTVRVSGTDWRTIVRNLPDGARLQVAAKLGPLEDRERRLRLVVLAALAGALLATAFVTRSLARLALAPLARLRATAGDVAETADLSRRVDVGDGPEEVDALAGDLNAMLERLQGTAAGREAALASARRFAADAGHELRTPLTSLEANLSTGSIDAARRDADRLAALVEQLQALARGEAGPPARAEDVDLGELADQVVLGVRSRSPDILVRLEAPEQGPVVRGEAESLRMLLDNLVGNAALHGRRPGEVVVTAAALETGGAQLLVDDDGPGIRPDDRARVLERFARGPDVHGPGSGLGLSIAAAQAARHGGALTLEDSPLGGLRVRVTLP